MTSDGSDRGEQQCKKHARSYQSSGSCSAFFVAPKMHCEIVVLLGHCRHSSPRQKDDGLMSDEYILSILSHILIGFFEDFSVCVDSNW